MKELETRIKSLINDLESANKLELLGYGEASTFTSRCIYIVYDEDQEVTYVGKTARTGKLRLREMASDYRSHTLNRKLLKTKLEQFLKFELKSLTNNTKQELIERDKISIEKFKELQKAVNLRIKESFKFKLYKAKEERLTRIEHFFISVFNPPYND